MSVPSASSVSSKRDSRSSLTSARNAQMAAEKRRSAKGHQHGSRAALPGLAVEHQHRITQHNATRPRAAVQPMARLPTSSARWLCPQLQGSRPQPVKKAWSSGSSFSMAANHHHRQGWNCHWRHGAPTRMRERTCHRIPKPKGGPTFPLVHAAKQRARQLHHGKLGYGHGETWCGSSPFQQLSLPCVTVVVTKSGDLHPNRAKVGCRHIHPLGQRLAFHLKRRHIFSDRKEGITLSRSRKQMT